ncbi:MAG: hypothetical protein ACI921_001831 [Polaribacter sp.]
MASGYFVLMALYCFIKGVTFFGFCFVKCLEN